MEPNDPSLGFIEPPLSNMHDANGCKCEEVDVTDMRINHYLGSAGDYLEKTKRFWEVLCVKPDMHLRQTNAVLGDKRCIICFLRLPTGRLLTPLRSHPKSYLEKIEVQWLMDDPMAWA